MPRGKNPQRRRQARLRNEADDSSDDGGFFMVGGVRVHVDSQGNAAMSRSGRGGRRQRPPPPPPRRRSPSPSDSDALPGGGSMGSDDMLDYLQNIGAAGKNSDNSDSEGGSGGRGDDPTLGLHRFEMLRFAGAELGDEGAPEDVIGRFYDEESEEESSSGGFGGGGSDDSGGGTDSDASSFSSGEESEEEGGMGVDRSESVLTAEEMEGLALEMRFPVSVRPAAPAAAPGDAQAGGSGKKGKKGARLAPGEKSRMRRERIETKRAARAAGRGFDLASVNKDLQDFVDSGLDIHGFPPAPKHECKQICRLAALYGCKAGAQGSGKRRSVIVVATPRTALPTGIELLEVGRLLAAHTAAELGAAPPPSAAEKGRWAEARRQSGGRAKKNSSRRRFSGAVGLSEDDDGWFHAPPGPKPSRRKSTLRPVAFVSRGLINPEDDSMEVYERSTELQIEVEAVEAAAGSESSGPEDAGPAAGPPQVEVVALEVFEDRRGLDASAEEEEVVVLSYERHSGLGFGGSGGSGSGGGSSSGLSLSRGAAAAEGITNSGRLLGLGMALGIGAEVFGAPGPSMVSEEAGGGGRSGKEGHAPADLSPLMAKPTKAAQRKAARRRSGGGMPPPPVPPPQVSVQPPASVQSPKRASGGSGGRVERRLEGRTGPGNAAVSGDYADFEAHTTGIGSKLLAKWGFSGAGAGLGRQGNGISEPLQVKMRAKKLGLGAER